MDKKQNSERVSSKHFLHSFKEAFDFQDGWLYTFRELTFRPGSSIIKYVNGERKLTNPIKYLVLAISLSFLATFLNGTFGPEKNMFEKGELEEQVATYVLHISLTLAFAIVVFLFNRKKGFNFYELLLASIYWFTNIVILTIIIIDFGGLLLYILSYQNEFVTGGVRVLVGLTILLLYLVWAVKSFLTISLLKSSLIMMVVLFTWFVIMAIQIKVLESIFQNPDTEIGIIAGLPEEEKKLYDGKTFLAWKSTLQVDSIIINGPAAVAGVLKGDTILSINGKKVHWSNFRERIAYFEPGETILLTIQRQGLKHEIPIILINRDSLSRKIQYSKPN